MNENKINENKINYPLISKEDIKKDQERSIRKIYNKFMFQSNREYEELIKKEFGGYDNDRIDK